MGGFGYCNRDQVLLWKYMIIIILYFWWSNNLWIFSKPNGIMHGFHYWIVALIRNRNVPHYNIFLEEIEVLIALLTKSNNQFPTTNKNFHEFYNSCLLICFLSEKKNLFDSQKFQIRSYGIGCSIWWTKEMSK